jgi:two-component system, OmpR family, sensor histidine kinase BaeS
MRTRLILAFIFVMFLSIACVVIIARRSTAREIQAFMLRGTMTQVDSLKGELEAYYRANGSWQGAEKLLPITGQGIQTRMGGQGMGGPGMGMMNLRVRLADANGTVLIDTSGATIGNLLNLAERRSAVALRLGFRRVGLLVLDNQAGFTPGEGRFLISRLNRAALIAAVVAGGLTLLVALLLSDRLIQPVVALTRAARRMAQGDLTQQVSVNGDDELAELGQAFNHMANSLRNAEENRRQMTADIAHELRNPLAVQRAQLEAMQDGVYPVTQANLQPVLDQNLFLTHLVEDLRTLALADAGQLSLERVPTDLLELVGRIVERFKPRAESLGISLLLDSSAEPQGAAAQMYLDPLRIEQILGNLLSNAMRYTPQGGVIMLKPSRSGNTVQIKVQDSGPGIAPDDLPHIFERFYRADKARSRAEGGSGLGLAIARQLAEMQGGTLTAANAPQGGAIFTLSLPNASAISERSR